MKTETWYGNEIRFVEINGEWYAILKDICNALKLRTDKIASRLHPEMLERVKVDASNNPSRVVRCVCICEGCARFILYICKRKAPRIIKPSFLMMQKCLAYYSSV